MNQEYREKLLLDIIKANKGVTVKDLCHVSGLSIFNVRISLKPLLEENLIYSKPYHYDKRIKRYFSNANIINE